MRRLESVSLISELLGGLEWGAELPPPDGLERQYRFPVVIRRYLAFEFLDRDIYFDAFDIFLHGSSSFIDLVGIRSDWFGPGSLYTR